MVKKLLKAIALSEPTKTLDLGKEARKMVYANF